MDDRRGEGGDPITPRDGEMVVVGGGWGGDGVY